MGCTTTQRAESGHGALKHKMIFAQHLCVAFDRVHEYLKDFERSYEEQSRLWLVCCRQVDALGNHITELSNIPH